MYTGIFECLTHANDANGCGCAHWIQRHAIKSEIKEAMKGDRHSLRLPPRSECCFNVVTILCFGFLNGPIWVYAACKRELLLPLMSTDIGQLLSIVGLSEHHQKS